MNPSRLLPALGLLLFASCFSKQPVEQVHYFRPELEALSTREGGGTRALQLPAVETPLEIGPRMLWRVSATELVPDDQNLWARRPEELLDERLRDLLFGGGGFRSSLRAGDPVLEVRLVTCEADLLEEPAAVVELVVTFAHREGIEHRRRFVVREPMARESASELARAVGVALSRAAGRTAAWLEGKW